MSDHNGEDLPIVVHEGLPTPTWSSPITKGAVRRRRRRPLAFHGKRSGSDPRCGAPQFL